MQLAQFLVLLGSQSLLLVLIALLGQVEGLMEAGLHFGIKFGRPHLG